MSFLNFALLGGVLALAIPIIIHLFHKSRFQIVRWGAMHLLEAVIRTNQRRIKIEQIILLIIRAAIPVILALCMARPVWKGLHKLVGDARTSTVILLDNSYSMAASRAGTSNFSLAKDEAARLLNELPRGSDAQVVLMGEGGAPLLDEPTYDLARLTQALKQIEADYGTATVPAGLDFAANVFGRMHESARNLVVMTDFQRVSFEATEDAEVGQMLDRLRKLPLPPEITFFNIGSEVKDNVAIESLDFSRLMVGVGQKIQIRANLQNFGDVPYQDLRVYFKADGKERSMSQIRLGPHEKGQVLFTHAFDTAGSHFVEVVADADALKADNSYLASIPVRDKIPVLLVNGDPSPEPLKGETDFAEIALQPFSSTGKVALADLIATKVVRPENLDAAILGNSAVVLLANVRKLDDRQVRALEDFVRNGGGLLIFPGNRVDPAWTNTALFKDGKGLLPLALGALGGDLKEGSPSVGIVSQRFDHPALDIFNDPRNGTVSDAAIQMWYKLKEPATVSANAPTIVARLTSGDPFLAEKQFGDGRVIECAIPCDADWSNLPMRPFYLPLLQRLSIYLASTVFPPRNLEVSKPLVAFLPVADAGKQASLTLPDGTTQQVPVVKKGERGVVEYARTQQPGLYTLNAPGGSVTHFVVNTSRRESDLQKLTDAEIADFAKSHNVSVVHSGAEYKQLDRSRRYGSEFWRALLWLLLGLLFAELFLQQRFSRVRRPAWEVRCCGRGFCREASGAGMNSEHVQTALRFVGDWPWYVAFGLGLVLAGAAAYLYRRETSAVRLLWRVLLPLLRALAVFMIVLMLCGPVLHHRKIIGQLSRLLLFVDGSKSMGLTDRSMSSGRKILILQRLGLWRSDAVKMDLPQAGEALAEAQTLAGRSHDTSAASADGWHTLTRNFEAKIGTAHDALVRAGLESDRLDAFVRELSVSARELASREVKQLDDRTRAAQDLGRLGEAAGRWQKEINARFDQSLQAMSPGENSPLKTALAKFDGLPRWQRLQSMLLEGEKEKLLARLAEKFDVRLLEIDGAEARKLWQPTGKESTLPAGLPQPVGDITNLATALKNAASDDSKTERGAVVLFSDGQHNEGESPIEVAKILAGRGLPIYTVGFGSDIRPRDLAVVKVEAPDSVFFEDRIQGQITLKDDLPAGLPFTVMIQDGDKVLWQQQMIAEGHNLRKVPFSFPMSESVQERLKNKPADTEMTAVPLELKVSVSNVEGDSEPSNNTMTMRVRALTQRRRILLLDGRPRWETRYLRNMFERDEQWQINTVIAGATEGEAGFPRGDKDGQFPNDVALLQPYDLIVFGEVPRALFKDEELKWLRDFVGNRGGALVFIDGPRQRLKEYTGTPLEALFPVEWKGAGVRENGMKLSLTERAATLAPFALSPEKSQNVEIWGNLPPPHWVANVTALPGAETLVEASAGGKKLPAVVARPFGAGKVLYQGFDDSWRWRFEVADQYHVRYWNQIANWLAELPFAVRDKLISLDAGALVYRPGDSADLRVRLRDGQGRPVTNAAVDAVLFRDGRRVATIRLSPEENAGGLFRGRTASLEPGSYEVAVESAGIAERDAKARTGFKVEPLETGELTQLNLNEELLRQMSALTGGEYLREENIDRLVDLLAPMSQGRVVESDTVLWQSYWWFVPIVLLLTAEWIIRKRVGML